MLKNDECSSTVVAETGNQDFTHSVSFNIAAYTGLFYAIFLPIYVLLFICSLFSAITSLFSYNGDSGFFKLICNIWPAFMGFGLVTFVLFILSFCFQEPITNMKYNTISKVSLWFGFVAYLVVSSLLVSFFYFSL